MQEMAHYAYEICGKVPHLTDRHAKSGRGGVSKNPSRPLYQYRPVARYTRYLSVSRLAFAAIPSAAATATAIHSHMFVRPV